MKMHKMPDGTMMPGAKHPTKKKMARGGGVELRGKTQGKKVVMKRKGGKV